MVAQQPCPVCGERIDGKNYVAYRHLLDCGAFGGGYFECCCGETFATKKVTPSNTVVMQYFEHIKSHDGCVQQILTMQQLKEF